MGCAASKKNAADAPAAKDDGKGLQKSDEQKKEENEKLKKEVIADALGDIVVKIDEEYKGPAPYLHEYHMKCIAKFDELMAKGVEYMIAVGTDPEVQAAHKKEEEAHHAVLKELIEKSFKLHDKNSDDVLDPEEAAVFFEHFCAESALMIEATSKLAIRRKYQFAIESSVDTYGAEKCEDKEGLKAHMKAGAEAALERAKTTIKTIEQGYLENKEERNAAAFKITDTNGDGTLSLAEAIAVLTPGGEKNKQFMQALGYIPEQPLQSQSQAQAQAPAQAQPQPQPRDNSATSPATDIASGVTAALLGN
eukprot:gnl/MRDRNA2_/MRDRNA2_91153_c0_seq1.p1 gnl/MRDRNA2_/MRDRNA2_91153_c0~~gnl/MRDRNA2_/MRDRNA2_91153_c0_seq1.p1  ORF type:complete len:307 (+),score=90.99 gnl/MRDRNA2_/MRDRNA2_91153_c0_seq1:104-1024(+)